MTDAYNGSSVQSSNIKRVGAGQLTYLYQTHSARIATAFSDDNFDLIVNYYKKPTPIGGKMVVELSVREMELIRNLIAEKQLVSPMTFDRLTDEEECKVAVMLKLFVALEDAVEVLAH